MYWRFVAVLAMTARLTSRLWCKNLKVRHAQYSAALTALGETVSLAFASVSATENLMMASVFAKSVTVVITRS